MLSPFECLCGNFILPEPASYVFFYVIFNLRNLLYIILLHLCDIEIGYLQLMVFPHIIPNLVVSRLAFRSSHIQFIHADVHFDVPLDIEFGQKENRFAMA